MCLLIGFGSPNQQEITMKKFILAATCAAALATFTTAGAFAQSTGPGGQDTTRKGTDTPMSQDGMSRDGMSKGGMKNDGMQTQGMSRDGMAKDGMKKDGMKKDGMSK